MKKRPKITIKSNKPKIQIKGPGSGDSSTSRQPDPDSGRALKKTGLLQTIGTYLNNKYWLFGLLIFFGTLTAVLVASFYSHTVSPTEPSPPDVTERPSETGLEDILRQEDDVKTVIEKLISEKDYDVSITVLETDSKLGDILMKEGLSDPVYNELLYLAKRKNIDLLKATKTWYAIKSPYRKAVRERFYVYEVSPSQSYLIKALPDPDIILYTKAELLKIKAVAGLIKTSLWDAVMENGGNYRIIDKMEDALKWVVDLYHVKPNDRFKIIYEEKWVGDKVVDVGKLLAVSFQTGKKVRYAFYFKDKYTNGYFDAAGKSMKRKFLQSPVKYNRITSPYNPARLHPVKNKIMPHFGTDYYAKLGDPVFAVANGTILVAGAGVNNGNYIKIKHDEVYETQYLHLMKDNPFAKGIKKGATVKQGQVIGYAGQTGLASGVHVCYRFWKNGKQVDPLLEEIVQAEQPILLNTGAFETNKDSLLKRLNRLTFF